MRERFEQRLFRLFDQAGYSPVQLLTITPEEMVEIPGKCPDAVRVGGYKAWHAQGVEILEDEKRLPIIILEPGKAYRREDGSVGQNFYAKEVYDISQTTARDQVQPQVRYDDRLLLKGLIASSPVPIRAVEELPQGRGAIDRKSVV